MANLDKMLIVGIRSFDAPKESQIENQMIKFCPLTLILGVNGAGKTTIIECLRYATSGETPPGTNGGKTWIHDPQFLTSGGVVRAQVRMQFNSHNGHVYTVHRSLELVTKKSRDGKVTQTMRTLDSTMEQMTPSQGEKGTNSYVPSKTTKLPTRCAEIDKEMLGLMGVSKAVLTNVVFCHQEDNCWPLSEGKVLKEKFDQIFGSTGYVNALKKIKAYRKRKSDDYKNLTYQHQTNQEVLGQKTKFEKQLNDFRAAMTGHKKDRNDMRQQLKPVEDEILKLSQEVKSMESITNNTSRLKGELNQMNKTRKTFQSKISEDLSALSIEELQERLDAMDSFESSVKSEINALKKGERSLENDIKIERNKKDALFKKMSKLEAEENVMREQAEQHKTMVNQVAKELDMEGERDVEVIKDKLNHEMSRLTETIDSGETKEEAELYQELEELKTSKIQTQQTLYSKEETQTKRDEEMKTVLDGVNAIETSAGKVVSDSKQVLTAVKSLSQQNGVLEDAVSSLDANHTELQDDVISLRKVYSGLKRETVFSLKELQEEIESLTEKIKEKGSRLNELKSTRIGLKKSARQQQDHYKNLLSMISARLPTSCDSSSQGSQPSIQNSITSCETNIENLEAKLTELEAQLREKEMSVNGQKDVQRNLEDNIYLLKLDKQIELKAKQLMDEESKLSGKDSIALNKKITELRKRQSQLNNECCVIEGKMSQLQGSITTHEKDLLLDKYQSIQQRSKETAVRLAVMKETIDDLDKYYKVLDKAVSTYHVRKMEAINDAIEHFWRITYKGNDIDNIKIVCDDTESAGVDKRKVYNYRVVMVKDDVEMDMRGRCSAGQKVLASIVIRIALTQIFCNNCSVLTLDEPTTNLDKDNIESLAKAICSIVSESKGKLQLVIITHDNEFLKYIDQQYSEFYYEVKKEENKKGKLVSKIFRNYLD